MSGCTPYLSDVLGQGLGFTLLLSGPAHSVRMVSPGHEQVASHPPEPDRPLADAMPELAEQGFVGFLDQVYASGSPYAGRAMPLRLGLAEAGLAREYYLDFDCQPIKSPSGSVGGILVRAHDVTDHVRTSRELQTSRELLGRALQANDRLLAHSLDVVCTMDRSGVYQQVSARCTELWGYEPEELIGRNYLELVLPEDAERTRLNTAQVLAGIPTRSFENRVLRKDGRVVPILWSSVWSEEHGTIFSVARDITDRLRVEEKLRQAHKMEAVGRLTGGIAHDFNNLLAVILGQAEALLESRLDREARDATAAIIEVAERGAELVKDLLAFGRRQPFRPEYLKLDGVVAGMLPLLRRTLGEHIEVRSELPPSLLSTLTDRSLLENAILNLVVNAADAMPSGGTLTIHTGQRAALDDEPCFAPGQDVVFLSLSDTGRGMSAEVQARAFEPFFTTKDVGKGTGLGLPMVHSFAQQAGGMVAIRSEVGQGTTVSLIFPGVISAAASALSSPSEPEAAPANLKKRVLLVEDEPRVLQFVSTQLLSMGYEVTAVENGVDALRALRQDGPFDVLFTDLMLPKGLSGVELARAAREARPEMKVLLTSGYSNEWLDGRSELDPSIPLLRKPYRRKELAETLRLLLDSGMSAFH